MRVLIKFGQYLGFVLEVIAFMVIGFAIAIGNKLLAGIFLLIGLMLAFIVGRLIVFEERNRR